MTFVRHFIASFALLVGVAPAAAQDIGTSTIVGTVTDATHAAVFDAAVTLNGPHLIGGPRTTRTDRSGAYRFALLPAGPYEVSVTRAGFVEVRRSDVRLPGDRTLAVDLVLSVEGLREAVHVSAAAPMVDVKTAAAPPILDRDLLDNLPTDRVLANLMNLAPGVNVSTGLGGTQQSNPIYVDGVNLTDPQQLAPAAQLNVNWLEEVQIAGVGAGADVGEFNGIVQTARLRSGGNRVSGSAEYRTTRPAWVGTNTASLTPSSQANLQSVSMRIVDWHDANAQVGGPIVTDRLWYFGGFQHFTNNARPALVSGPDSIDERDRRALVKISAAPSTAVRLEGFYEQERNLVANDGLSPSAPVSATTVDTTRVHDWSGRAMWILGDRTTMEFRNASLRSAASFDPTPPRTRSGPPGHIDIATGVGSGMYFDFTSIRNVTTATWNRYVDGVFGAHHAVKVAGEFERAQTESLSGYPGGRQYLDLNGAPYLLYEASGESSTNATVRRATAFAQDDWTARDRLTIQLGLRISVNDGLVYQGSVVSMSPVDPRIGIAWEVARARQTVVRAHFGRYHDATLTAHFSAVDGTPQPTTVTSQFVDNQFVEIGRSTQTTNYRLDPNLSAAYFDQTAVGVERQVAAHWSLTAQFVDRRYQNLVGVIDTGSVYREVQRPDPGPDGQVGTSDDGAVLRVYQVANPGHSFFEITNPPSAFRRYSALQLIARKQFAGNWQMQASYVRSSTRGNLDNAARSNAGGPENGFNGIFANPNRAINAEGSSSFDFTHEFKVLGSWRMPWWGGATLSGVYRYHTGLAWGRTVTTLQGIPATFGVRIEPRGTRRTDAFDDLDLRVEKTFALTNSRRVGLFADVFNVGNQGAPDPSKLFAVEFRSGRNFGQPLYWLAPRTARVGARLTF